MSRFVTVGQKVRLEVLDWGGAGRPLVLLPGGGNTAHVFDDFAPRLARDFHVYGITRRGFGESGFEPLIAGVDTFGDDVLAVLDALNLQKPILVGHSIGGQELSSVATRFPNRVAALVYLDAAYPYAFDNGKGPTMKEFAELAGYPQPPPPAEADLASFDALPVPRPHAGIHVSGRRASSAAFRHTGRPSRTGATFPGNQVLLEGMKQYGVVRVPALVLVSVSGSIGRWADVSTDSAIREQARTYTAAAIALTERQTKSLEDSAPNARVVRLAGAHHYLFLSNEAEVLREMRAFLGGLR